MIASSLSSREQPERRAREYLIYRRKTSQHGKNSPPKWAVELCEDYQQLKALPLPGFFFWPGGQKPFLFAPLVLAVAARFDIPVVLACGGVPVTRAFLLGAACVTARPELKARIAAAATEMLSVRMIFLQCLVERLLPFNT